MKTCPGCSRSVADVIGQCPFCRHVFPVEEGAKPMVDPELISAAIAAERGSGTGRWRLGQTLFLFLALPVLVPSLIWFWIGAKRWGRVDWLLLAVTGGVLTLFTLGSPVFFAMMLIADASAAALFMLRYERLDYGIFLGYSNSVAFPLILGGLVGGFGALVYLPLGPINQMLALYWLDERTTPAELGAEVAPPGPKPVTLTGAKLAKAGAWLEQRTEDGIVLVKAPSTEIVEVADPGDLWKNRNELAGQFVRLANAPAPTHTFMRANVPFSRTPAGKKETDGQSRIHGVLPGFDARVWITSDPVSPPADEELQQLQTARERVGMLVLADTDRETARAWTATGRREHLPGMIALVVPGRPEQKASDGGWPVYVPVEGTRNRLWVRFSGGMPDPLPVDISGIFDKDYKRMEKLSGYLQKTGEPISGGLRVVTNVSRAEFAASTGIAAACTPRDLGTGLVLMGIGALLTLAGLIAALRE